MHFVNSIPPFGLRRRRCGHVTALCLHAEFILLITITTLSYISRMDIYIFMALSSVGFVITISELLPDSATARAPPLPSAAYGGERQRFNQLHCRRQIICAARRFKGHVKSSLGAYLRVLGAVSDPPAMLSEVS